jgi:hypothetical protein
MGGWAHETPGSAGFDLHCADRIRLTNDRRRLRVAYCFGLAISRLPVTPPDRPRFLRCETSNGAGLLIHRLALRRFLDFFGETLREATLL